MGVQPGQPLAIADRQHKGMDPRPGGEQLAERFEQGIAALPCQRRYRHDHVIAARLGLLAQPRQQRTRAQPRIRARMRGISSLELSLSLTTSASSAGVIG